MSVDQVMLPEQFAELEPFVSSWALPRAHDRYQRRLSSSMDEMQAFYDAISARGEEAIAYLDQFDLDDLPEPALRLFWMLCSLSTVSFAIDIYKQPKVPDSGAAYLDWIVEPGP